MVKSGTNADALGHSVLATNKDRSEPGDIALFERRRHPVLISVTIHEADACSDQIGAFAKS